MSDRIAEFKEAKYRLRRVGERLKLYVGLDGPRNDKHRMTIKVSLGECGYGYYGSSSYYGGTGTEEEAQVIERAVNSLKTTIVEQAIRLLEADVVAAKIAAEADAKEVLAACERE